MPRRRSENNLDDSALCWQRPFASSQRSSAVEQCFRNSKRALFAGGSFRQLEFFWRNFANVHNGFCEFAFFTGGNRRQLANAYLACRDVKTGCKNLSRGKAGRFTQ
jgi:hypothetical protein